MLIRPTPQPRTGNDSEVRRFWGWWHLLWPLRQYLRYSPLRKGKGRLVKLFFEPVLPRNPASFVAELPTGGVVELRSDEAIGYMMLSCGAFEPAEAAWLCRHAAAGATAIDVGANVGVLTVQLANAVGARGRVIACEPVDSTVERLKRNIELNGLNNVEVLETAIGASDGIVDLHIGTDPASHSTVEVLDMWRTPETIHVSLTTLDSIWCERNKPNVSVLKVDVEGGELNVLDGARRMLGEARPCLLVETRPPHQETVEALLIELGYRRVLPRGFEPWNHAFVADPAF